MAVRFLDLKAQYESVRSDIDRAIADVIRDSAFVSSEYVTRFEQEFAKYQGAIHCIGCGNGTDAIEIALEALELPQNAEVIVPANTFIASSEAVTRSGLRVVFCDCDSDDYTISLSSVRSKITPTTAAILVVHLYGQPCNMDPVLELAAEYDLKVIEDCAQAHGADYKGRRVGTIGTVGTFSFYPGKNLGGYGDAGAIVTNDANLARMARMIANHGRIAKYDHEFEGRNSRLDGIQAAILSAKLPHLELWTERRSMLARRYHDLLIGLEAVALPARRNWGRHVHHAFVIRCKKRDALKTYLSGRGIETGIHYPIALPKLQAYAYLNQADEDFFANRADRELLSLPIGDHMTELDVEEVVSACREFFSVHDH